MVEKGLKNILLAILNKLNMFKIASYTGTTSIAATSTAALMSGADVSQEGYTALAIVSVKSNSNAYGARVTTYSRAVYNDLAYLAVYNASSNTATWTDWEVKILYVKDEFYG